MRKLYKNFHIFHFKKRIVSAETIRGNTILQKPFYLAQISLKFTPKFKFKFSTFFQVNKKVTNQILYKLLRRHLMIACKSMKQIVMSSSKGKYIYIVNLKLITLYPKTFCIVTSFEFRALYYFKHQIKSFGLVSKLQSNKK